LFEAVVGKDETESQDNNRSLPPISPEVSPTNASKRYKPLGFGKANRGPEMSSEVSTIKSPVTASKFYKEEDCYSPYRSPTGYGRVKRLIASPDHHLQATIIEFNE